MNEKQAMGLIKEVAEIGTQTIRKEKWLKKNWRFVAICLTVLFCVSIVCGTAYGVICHVTTINALKEIAYATEIVKQTFTEENAETNSGGIATVGDSNNITMGGGY